MPTRLRSYSGLPQLSCAPRGGSLPRSSRLRGLHRATPVRLTHTQRHSTDATAGRSVLGARGAACGGPAASPARAPRHPRSCESIGFCIGRGKVTDAAGGCQPSTGCTLRSLAKPLLPRRNAGGWRLWSARQVPCASTPWGRTGCGSAVSTASVPARRTLRIASAAACPRGPRRSVVIVGQPRTNRPSRPGRRA